MKANRVARRLIGALLAACVALAAGGADAGPKRRPAREVKVDADKPSSGSKASSDGPRRVRSGAHIEVLARDLRLTDVAREKLERIAARYHKTTKKRLVVTGGTRTPERQAKLMLEKLTHGEDIVALYENKAAATEVRDAYRDGLARKLKRPALVKVLKGVIDGQVARGVYVSKHLQSGAADVRSRDMTPPREAAFRAAVAEEPGVVLLDERKSAEPHLHLSL